MFERLNMVRYIFLAKNKQGQSVFYGVGSISGILQIQQKAL